MLPMTLKYPKKGQLQKIEKKVSMPIHFGKIKRP